MSDHDELNRHGIDTGLHERVLALKAAAAAKGLDWAAVLRAIKRYGPPALDVLEELLGPTTPPAPKP